MALPVLSDAEIAAIDGAKKTADAGAAGVDLQIAAMETSVSGQQSIDDGLKKFWIYYDDAIKNTEKERRYMDGQTVQDPIVEQDIINCANNSGRLFPTTQGVYVPIRIAQFDGTPLVYVNDTNETDQFPKQDVEVFKMVSGISTILLSSAVTSTALTPSSTSVTIQSTVVNSVAVNDKILIHTGGDVAIIKVNSVAFTPSTSATPNIHNLGFDYDVVPSGNIPSMTSVVDTFVGFNNSERTVKIAGVSWQQSLMNGLLSNMTAVVGKRLTAIQNITHALQSNPNDGKAVGALPNAQASLVFVSGYYGVSGLLDLDISDVGLNSLNAEKLVRQPQVTTRLGQLPGEITVSGFYDNRYQFSSNRCHLGNGTLTIIGKLNASKVGLLNGKTQAQGLSARYAAMLP